MGGEHRTHVRPSVDLDEPDAQILVNQEVIAYDFKFIARPFPGIQLVVCGQKTIDHDVLHALHDMVDINVRVLGQEILFEVIEEEFIRHLVAVLESLIILRLHLVAVVRQMDVLVLVRQRVFLAARAQIARLVDEEVALIVDECQDSNVELTPVEEQRFFDILLHDDCLVAFAIGVVDKLLPAVDDLDASASVLVVRFANPDVLEHLTARKFQVEVVVLFESAEGFADNIDLWAVKVFGEWDDEAEGHRMLEHVARILEERITVVILPQCLDEASFGGDDVYIFEVIVGERFRNCGDSLGHCVEAG